MSRKLAEFVIFTKDKPELWYILADMFEDEGLSADSFMLKVDGMAAGMIREAEVVMEAGNATA